MALSMTMAFTSLIAVLLLLAISPVASADIAYCSSQNTADGVGPFPKDHQSQGECTLKCAASYAFAVLKEKDCWCSNFAPADQASTAECDAPCPGYPYESCGSLSGDKYVYLAMKGKQPSGTKGSPEPTSKQSEPSPTHTTLQRTTSTSESSSESETEPVTSAVIVTVSGNIVTQTVVVRPTSPAAPALDETKKSSSNVGAIAGGVVGGVIGLAAIVGGIFFFLWRRRRQQDDDYDQSGVHRNTSTMSKAGLIRTEKAPQHPAKIHTNFNSSTRNSRMMQDSDSISPVSGSDRRNSRLHVFDQRLNPSAIMTFDNGSRGSIVSMDDSRDYGRTLNVRNPDPDPRA